MAVHLNAHLNTRFIPVLFTLAILVSVGASIAHAHAYANPADGATDLAGAQELDPADLSVPSRELEAVMGQSVDPARVDRRPGLSAITVDLSEEPSGEHASVTTDELQSQPQEALRRER